MRTLRLSLVGTVILALLAGLSGAVVAQSEESEPMAFPTGTLVAVENNYLLLEFHEDGTGFGQDVNIGGTVSFTYATNGDLYTEMTNNAGRQVPATYYRDFDGEHLTMELWGEDLIEHRNFMYADNTWMPVEDPVLVVVADRDLEVREPVWVNRGFVLAAEAGPDAYTSLIDVVGYVAAVPISKGQPITPDLLEPVAEYPHRAASAAYEVRPARGGPLLISGSDSTRGTVDWAAREVTAPCGENAYLRAVHCPL